MSSEEAKQRVTSHPSRVTLYHFGFAGEVIFNLAILLLGMAIIAGSIELGLGRLTLPGPGLFPLFAGLAICAGELLVMYSIFSRTTPDTGSLLDRTQFRKLASLLLVFVGWMLAMPVAGYLIVTFAAVFAFAKLLDLKGWMFPLALSAGTSVLIYILFDRLLYLDLPRGFLG